MRALASLAAVAFLQSQPPDSCAPKFAVASIHPHQQQPGSYIGFSAEHGTVRAIRTNLKLLIMGSYDVHEFQVSGGPGWIDREWYDIAAKADDDAKDQNVMLMMRCLLADRFKLAFHREKQEQTVFELAVAKNGPRIHKSAPDAAYSMRLSAGGIMTATAMGMSDFVNWLSSAVHRPVTDKTGLAGGFDIKLEWTPDGAEPDADGTRAPSIFTALQEQLGLRLESRKAPVEVLVIDHAERPGEN